MMKRVDFLNRLLQMKTEESAVEETLRQIKEIKQSNQDMASDMIQEEFPMTVFDIEEVKENIDKQKKIRLRVIMGIFWIMTMILLIADKSISFTSNKFIKTLVYFLPFVVCYIVIGYFGFKIKYLRKINDKYNKIIKQLNKQYNAKSKFLNAYLRRIRVLEYQLFEKNNVKFIKLDLIVTEKMHNFYLKCSRQESHIDFEKILTKIRFENIWISNMDKYLLEEKVKDSPVVINMDSMNQEEYKEFLEGRLLNIVEFIER